VFVNFLLPELGSLFSEIFTSLSCSVPDLQNCCCWDHFVVIPIALIMTKTVTWGRPSTVASALLDSRLALYAV
jgi:hypothetical protein